MTRPPHRFVPPMRKGVNASCVALPAGPWRLLSEFLAQRFDNVAPDVWRERLAQGLVLDEQGTALPSDAPYRPQTRVYYYRELVAEPHIPFEESVLYQDEHLVVADKPHFLPVTPTGRFVHETLLVRLKRQLGLDQLSPVHRIDRETAGLVLFSVRPQERGAYHALFRERNITKEYEAIAPFREDLALPPVYRSRIEPDARFFRQREVAGEPNSETQIELLEVRGALARYRLTPVSGKTHQLRVHMNALGRPIVGDLFYPVVVNGPGHTEADYSQALQLLARTVTFEDPVTGESRHFESQRRLNWV
jgi:tRNA pseudouridine32 synthase / 23S rRNA pseudouridine746 synthase